MKGAMIYDAKTKLVINPLTIKVILLYLTDKCSFICMLTGTVFPFLQTFVV